MKPSLSISAAALLLAAAAAGTGCDALSQLLGQGAGEAFVEPPPPPPVSGGTLLVTGDGALAVAADGAGDRVVVVDLATRSVRHEIALEAGDEPGRVAEGPAGVAHVALRSGGAIADVDLETGAVTRREVCPAPRGLAYDPARDEIHVACAGGELVTLPSAPGAPPSRTLHLTRDLRDVVVHGDDLLVSRFRAADVLVVSADGGVAYRLAPAAYTSPRSRHFEPAVAWRMVPVPGGVAVVHQRAFADVLPTGPSATGPTYYGGGCDQSVVHAAVTVFDAEAGVRVTLNGKGALGDLTLPVDIAVSAEGKVAVVAAGASMVVETSLDAVVSTDALEACAQGSDRTFNVGGALAVAYGVGGELVIQSEVSLRIVQADGQIAEVPIAGPRVPHMGHALFHTAPAWPSAPVACASCHPEGRDDGRVWRFQGLGPRRTQTVLGGVLDTAPLHWEGDMDGLESLMGEVFVNRMGGVAPDETTLESLATFLQSMPALPAPDARDAAAAARGEALFRDPAVGCATCHAGEALTNDQTVYVGTGGAFQVPSLVGIADRAPFMHDGCATTLRDRFNPACGGGDAHGKTSQLAPEEIDDLVAFLETL